ncbi:hypothetical protein BpHYR1_023243 [Brachionus plicatilis]|uniref:Uncharacterized protein n=1 Tax=Brachionus plicatilis TaxID=10195 RepID=A0A3M7S8R2_BRAPC|nr:hypothetical protein BpHYR1_023243 [Brachionus plicatilis]
MGLVSIFIIPETTEQIKINLYAFCSSALPQLSSTLLQLFLSSTLSFLQDFFSKNNQKIKLVKMGDFLSNYVVGLGGLFKGVNFWANSVNRASPHYDHISSNYCQNSQNKLKG